MRNHKFLLSLLILLSSLHSFPQAPQAFKYQAMARNANGEAIVNQSISVFIEIIRNATTAYSESHNVITNQFGLINLEIGKGVTVAGVFSEIDWSLGDYYISVSIDPTGGANYLPVGTAQLLSVPYALYAGKSGNEYWENIQSNLDYNKGKVMIGSPENLKGTGDLNSLPTLAIDGGLLTKMPLGITTTNIDNMNLNNSSIGTGLPLNGLFSIYNGDYHLRGFWGVNIDRNGGNAGYSNSSYSGLSTDGGSFAVRYRTSPTAFRTDFIVNGVGNVGIGTTNPQNKLSIEGTEDGTGRNFINLKNNSTSGTSAVSLNMVSGNSGNNGGLSYSASSYNSMPNFKDCLNLYSYGTGGLYLTASKGPIQLGTNVGTNGSIIPRMTIDLSGKVMIGSPDYLSGNGDIKRLPALSVEGGILTKLPNWVTPAQIDNMNLDSSSIGTNLPLNGLYSLNAADYHLRSLWGVNIDRNGGNLGYDNAAYKGSSPDGGSFAVRYRTSPTTFRTDLIVNGVGNVGIGTTNPQNKLHIEGLEDGNGRNYIYLKNNSTSWTSAVGILLQSGISGNSGGMSYAASSYTYMPGFIDCLNVYSNGTGGIKLSAFSGPIEFGTNRDGVTTYIIPRMIIGLDGNVGIGVTNPQRTLHIKDVLRLQPIAAAPSNPSEGDIYMNSSTHKLMVYDGSTWQACW